VQARPKDSWDPHCDALDAALARGVKTLRDTIAAVPGQIAAEKEAGRVEREKQKGHYEKLLAQMKTKLQRKEEMFATLSTKLEGLDSLKHALEGETKKVSPPTHTHTHNTHTHTHTHTHTPHTHTHTHTHTPRRWRVLKRI
jgi:putative protein kinase ArgK-like GTPase of G3E family